MAERDKPEGTEGIETSNSVPPGSPGATQEMAILLKSLSDISIRYQSLPDGSVRDYMVYGFQDLLVDVEGLRPGALSPDLLNRIGGAIGMEKDLQTEDIERLKLALAESVDVSEWDSGSSDVIQKMINFFKMK